MRRVVVTGLGVVSPVGTGKDDFWDGLTSGRSGISGVTHFDVAAYPCRIAGEAGGFEASDYLDRKEMRRMDRFCQFAVAASAMAVEDAGLTVTSGLADRVGTIIGSGIGGLQTLEDEHKVMLDRGPMRVSPFLIPMMIADLAAGQVSIKFGLKGPNYCTVSACASGSHAIGEAFETIKRGAADIMVAGGTEAPITPLGLAGFCAVRALSTAHNDEPEKASRPFDRDRDGFVMGEGAGIVILETLEGARERGVPIYAELAGYGATGDAFHITQPDKEGRGAARAMMMALDEAGVEPGEVDYINAHGTSTKLNDEFETMAVKEVFGPHAYELAISSTKSMTGHLLGAAGGIEFVATVLAAGKDLIPPTINLENPDPECDLFYAPARAVSRPVRVAMSNSLGFGGHNASLLVKKL